MELQSYLQKYDECRGAMSFIYSEWLKKASKEAQKYAQPFLNELGISRSYVSRLRTVNNFRELHSSEPDSFFKWFDSHGIYKQYQLANVLHFYDRSIVDILAYLNISKIKPPTQILEFLKNNKYEQNVFFLKPWKEIYKKDNQRFEEFKHAEIINYNLEIVYKNLNYNLIEIPKMSIIQRAKYVVKKINS